MRGSHTDHFEQRRVLPRSVRGTTRRTFCAVVAVSRARKTPPPVPIPSQRATANEIRRLCRRQINRWLMGRGIMLGDRNADGILQSRPPLSPRPEAHLRLVRLPCRQDQEVYVPPLPIDKHLATASPLRSRQFSVTKERPLTHPPNRQLVRQGQAPQDHRHRPHALPGRGLQAVQERLPDRRPQGLPRHQQGRGRGLNSFSIDTTFDCSERHGMRNERSPTEKGRRRAGLSPSRV